MDDIIKQLNDEIKDYNIYIDIIDDEMFSKIKEFQKETKKEKAQYSIIINNVRFTSIGYMSVTITRNTYINDKWVLLAFSKDFINNRRIDNGVGIFIADIINFKFKKGEL